MFSPGKWSFTVKHHGKFKFKKKKNSSEVVHPQEAQESQALSAISPDNTVVQLPINIDG